MLLRAAPKANGFFFFFFEREKLLSARALVEYSNDQLDERAPASESTGTEP